MAIPRARRAGLGLLLPLALTAPVPAAATRAPQDQEGAPPPVVARAVIFGEAAPIAGSWAFQRHSTSELRCKVWLDDRLARDEDLDYAESVAWQVAPADPDEGFLRSWEVEYLLDSRSPSMERLSIKLQLDADGAFDYSRRPPPLNLVADQQSIHDAPPIARLVSGRAFEPQDPLVLPEEVAADLLLSRAAKVESCTLSLLGSTLVDDEPAARFALRARTRASLPDDGPVTTIAYEGSLELRLRDGAPLHLQVEGPAAAMHEWEEEQDARLRMEIEGTARHEARWRYGAADGR